MDLDSAIIWANLIILILLLVKFAAKPFMELIKGRKKQISDELSRLENEKGKISGEIGDTVRIINEKKALIAETEENIVRQGEIITAGIIREAEEKSVQILEKASRGVEQEVKAAAEKLRTDIINEIIDNQPGDKKD
jgi:F-type H+-transporting ATPase subunit b